MRLTAKFCKQCKDSHMWLVSSTNEILHADFALNSSLVNFVHVSLICKPVWRCAWDNFFNVPYTWSSSDQYNFRATPSENQEDKSCTLRQLFLHMLYNSIVCQVGMLEYVINWSMQNNYFIMDLQFLEENTTVPIPVLPQPFTPPCLSFIT